MKIFITIIFYVTLGCFPTGIILRSIRYPGGNFFLLLGFSGILIYFTARTIKDLVLKRLDPYNLVMQVLLILMSPILFSKYLYYFFGDYPGVIIIPLFLVFTLVYFYAGKKRYGKLTTATLVYLILSIPLFGLDFYKSPRRYIPRDWYDRYQYFEAGEIKNPYPFRHPEAEILNTKANEFRKNKEYLKAIILNEKAIKIEPDNPILYFDLSGDYAELNELEKAVALLDTAIMIDSTYPAFYNNRALLYHLLDNNEKAIRDYKKGIHFAPDYGILYANLALIYFHIDSNDIACELIHKAEQLGYDTRKYKELELLIKEFCQ